MNFTGERFIPGIGGNIIQTEHLHRYESVLPIVKNKVVLDIACGSGYGSYMLACEADCVYGVDISYETIEYANVNYCRDNLKFVIGNAEELDFNNDFFDVVISYETIEHLVEGVQKKLMDNIKRVLKNNGMLIISTPNKDVYSDYKNEKNVFHIKEYYKDQFYEFLKKYFEYVEIYDQKFCISSIISKYDTSTLRMLKPITNNGIYSLAVCSNISNNIDLSSIFPDVIGQNTYEIHKVYDFLKKSGNYLGKLYFDFGDGFSEESSVFLNYENLENGNKVLKFYEKFDKGVLRLRWDPIEGFFSVINIVSSNVIFDDSNKSCSENNKDYFVTIDPMYIIEIKNSRELRLDIEFIIDEIDDGTLSSLIEKKQTVNVSNKLDHNSFGKLYLDFGDGFSEENSILLSYKTLNNRNKIIKISKNFDKEVLRLRWDPIEGRFSSIRIVSTNLDLNSSNKSFSISDVDYFITIDPMYFSKKLKSKKIELEIEFYIEGVDESIIEDYVKNKIK